MDFDEIEDNFQSLYNGPGFPPHYDQLELDSLLFENDNSPESSSSCGFSDPDPGYRSRGSGSVGNSSTDSSPPLSCANVNEDEEMWNFGFQNPSPFQPNMQQNCYQDEQIPFQEGQTNSFPEHQFMDQFYEPEQTVVEPEEVQLVREAPRKQYIAIVPKTGNYHPAKRVTAAPAQKVYRVREPPATNRMQTFRVVQQIHHPPKQHQRPMFVESRTEPLEQSGPLVRHSPSSKVSNAQRYVPIAPTSQIKQEVQCFTQEQNRKIRNRMYAQASRIRKKEADETMRQKVDELMEENETLKAENAHLRQRLAYYEAEDTSFHAAKQVNDQKIHRKRKMIAAGTALMMFGLFAVISPFHLASTEKSMGLHSPVLAITNETTALTHRGRVLGNDAVEAGVTQEIAEPPPVNMNMHHSINQTNDCENLPKLNATETRRVNNDIDRWVQVHSFEDVPVRFSGGLLNKEAMREFNAARKSQKVTSHRANKESTLRKSEQAAIRSRERTWKQLDLLKSGNGLAPADSEKLNRKRQNIKQIASLVRQKGDTLYIVTLQDYVLLPSLNKGANSIPKLSLLLPSVPMNGTLLDQYSLLRVDCEVTGTGQLTLSSKQLSYLMP